MSTAETRSHLSGKKKLKRLVKKLEKLSSGRWERYIVEDVMFETKRDAMIHARRLAKVRGRDEGEWISKITIPDCLRTERMFSVEFPDSELVNDYLPDQIIYYVDAVPFLTLEEAEAAAADNARASGREHCVMFAMIKMSELDFEACISPDKSEKPKPVAEPAVA